MTQPNSQNTYVTASGTASTNPFVVIFETRDPNGNDINYPIQKIWLNTVSNKFWFLENFTSTTGIVYANWIIMSNSPAVTETLTGNTGGAVSVDSGNNINIVGDGTTITIAGDPATHTLTASVLGDVATLYTENSGTAIPALGNLNVLGGTGVSTTGSGSTITINADATVPVLFTENTGTATPAMNNLNVLGGTGISTSGSGSTITINATGSVPTTFTGNSGSATPAMNNLNVLGGTNSGLTVTGSGSTLTITGGAQLFFVAQQTASSSSSITFTSIGNYTTYFLVYRNVFLTGMTASSLQMQLSSNNGSSYASTGYASGITYCAYNSATFANINSTTFFYLITGAGEVSTSSNSGFCYLFNFNTVYNVNMNGMAMANASMEMVAGWQTTVSGANAFQITPNSGVITTGIFTLYGLVS